jgi:hypothetical protein
MIALCMGLASAVWAQLPISHFTLGWSHTIEKIRWEEDYLVTAQGLILTEARVRGSGAGMEIPNGARLENGSWRYQPRVPALQPLKLARTPQAGDYQICVEGRCRELSELLGPPSADRPALELWGCPPA